ncbi:20S proteasome subunit beta 7 [Nematocida sp. LUAm3]|nr:20S proteasome subunit beta 7 [Nematocida sp. LUAm3]KAI5176085.1 20S proteasome subunit beta 7 [Nematocida sp. LUAm2]KAI5177129.1 20S proteasome subunit beta 7 [Nematocida sp. LUAm1]
MLKEQLGVYTIKDIHMKKQEHGGAYVLGTSVLAVKYREGIMVATDMQASYGSYAKYKRVSRIVEISPDILLSSSGEYSNFQELVHSLRLEINPILPDEEPLYGPRECFEIVKNHMYEKRNEGQPEKNYHIIAGIEKRPTVHLPYEGDASGRFLAAVDQLGNFYHGNAIATGIGAHIALPILRLRGREGDISEEEAHSLLISTMTTLVYRDTRASAVIQMAKISREGIEISDPITLETNWEIGANVGLE